MATSNCQHLEQIYNDDISFAYLRAIESQAPNRSTLKHLFINEKLV